MVTMSSDFVNRVHVTDDLDGSLRNWPHMYRDDIIITPAGPFVVRQEDFYMFCRPAQRNDFRRLAGGWRGSKEVPPLLGVIKPKSQVPWELLAQAAHFFRDVWQRWRREDVLLLYYFFAADRYELVHPALTAASEHIVQYEWPPTPSEAVRFGSLHLHGEEGAYHSRIDDMDDKTSPGVHVILGNMHWPVPTIHCIVSDGKACWPVSPLDVFVLPPTPAVPEEWLIANVPRAFLERRHLDGNGTV
jgi:hypothetical protein